MYVRERTGEMYVREDWRNVCEIKISIIIT
jgi:hypothetical protein